MIRRNWTRSEIELAIKLYLILPFGRIHSKNPEIIELARKLERTPSALAMKMANFASLDTNLDRRGMSNVSALDREVWEDFFSKIDEIESENPRNDPRNDGGFGESVQQAFEVPQGRIGVDIMTFGKARRGQDFFRKMILASYDCSCALSGVSHDALLNASHIAPWSMNISQRLDPTNGLCLSATYDRAFDRGLIVFDEDLTLRFSRQMDEQTYHVLKAGASEKLRVPRRFPPNVELIKEHRMFFEQQHDYRC